MPALIKGHRYLQLAEKFLHYNVDSLAKRYLKRALVKFRKRILNQPCHSAFKGVAKVLNHLSPDSEEKKKVDEIVSLFNLNKNTKASLYCALANQVTQYREDYCISPID